MKEQAKQIVDEIEKIVGNEKLKEFVDELHNEVLKRRKLSSNDELFLECIHNISLAEECKKCKKETKGFL